VRAQRYARERSGDRSSRETSEHHDDTTRTAGAAIAIASLVSDFGLSARASPPAAARRGPPRPGGARRGPRPGSREPSGLSVLLYMRVCAGAGAAQRLSVGEEVLSSVRMESLKSATLRVESYTVCCAQRNNTRFASGGFVRRACTARRRGVPVSCRRSAVPVAESRASRVHSCNSRRTADTGLAGASCSHRARTAQRWLTASTHQVRSDTTSGSERRVLSERHATGAPRRSQHGWNAVLDGEFFRRLWAH
jgi:hypothetical protein